MQSDKMDGAKYFHALNFSTLDNKTLNIYLTWRRFQCPSEQLRYQTTAREIDGVVVAVVVVLSCWILSIQKDNFQFEWMSMSTMMLRWERCKDILIMLIKGKLLRSVPCQEHWPMKNDVFLCGFEQLCAHSLGWMQIVTLNHSWNELVCVMRRQVSQCNKIHVEEFS